MYKFIKWSKYLTFNNNNIIEHRRIMEKILSTFNVLNTKHKIMCWLAYSIIAIYFFCTSGFNFGMLILFLPYFLLGAIVYPFSALPVIYLKNLVVNMFANIWMNLYILLFIKVLIYGFFLLGLLLAVFLSPLIGIPVMLYYYLKEVR